MENNTKIERQKFQMHKKGYSDIVEAIGELKEVEKPEVQKVELQGISLVTIKGDKGEPGKDGNTPTKEELIKIVKPLIPEPKKGDKGDNYIITEKDKKEIAKSIKVPVVEKVIEKQIIEKPIITEIVKEVAKYEDAEIIADKLSRVEKQWLSIEAIKGDFNSKIRQIVHTGGATGVLEAPQDNKQYARKDGVWVEVAGDGIGDMLKATYDPAGGNKQVAFASDAYVLPKASTTVLGGVKQGPNITIDVNGVISATVSGSGDVVGPGSATNKGVALFDSTTGKLLKNSTSFVQLDNGNVGIGTTTPATKLHASSSVSTLYSSLSGLHPNGTNLTISNLQALDNTYAGIVFNVVATTTQPQYAYIGAISNNIARAADIVFGNRDNVSTYTEKMRISSSGNVGIGTTSPTDKFQVLDTRTTSGAAGIYSSSTGANVATGYAGYFAKTGASVTNVGIYATASGATNNYAGIFNGGSVGIGTITPGYKLDVNVVGTGGARIISDISAGLYITSGTGGANRIRYSNTIGANIFRIRDDDAGVDRLNIDQNGNLGIGTTSPTAKLHLPASTASANTASMKIPSGVVATTPVAGNIEADENHIYWTRADGTRLQLDN